MVLEVSLERRGSVPLGERAIEGDGNGSVSMKSTIKSKPQIEAQNKSLWKISGCCCRLEWVVMGQNLRQDFISVTLEPRRSEKSKQNIPAMLFLNYLGAPCHASTVEHTVALGIWTLENAWPHPVWRRSCASKPASSFFLQNCNFNFF